MTGQGESLQWEADELGEFVRIRVDLSVYGRAAVFKAAYWFTDRYHLFLSHPDQDETRLEVEVRLKTGSDPALLETAARDFCNSLIDYEVRQQVLSETAGVREHLLRKAFLEGAQAAGQVPRLVSDESHLPPQHRSAGDDPSGIAQRTGERDEDRSDH
jgi:His-Xaa-Ser system protein HxsD